MPTKNRWREHRGDELQELEEAREKQPGPCVYLAHHRDDVDAAVEIESFLLDHDIADTFRDEASGGFSSAHGLDESGEVYGALERGLARSTHVLVLYSERVGESWWAPFACGLARGRCEFAAAVLDGLEPPPFATFTEVIDSDRRLQKWMAWISDNYRVDERYAADRPRPRITRLFH